MTDIHVIHKRIGGVGHIAKLLEARGEIILDAKLMLERHYPWLNSGGKVFFHQPFSHICCLLYALAVRSKRANLCCVLHEASNYNLGVASLWRALVGTFCRFLVIRLCSLLGVEVRGVSDYVCSTYLLAPRRISYLYLFRDALESKSASSVQREDLAVFWLRRGDARNAFRFLANLHRSGCVSSIAVLGDSFECSSFLSQFESSQLPSEVKVLELNHKIDEQNFFQLLQSARWFVSVYPREGFGLSVFQAVYFGCVVLSQEKGAVGEWLPNINYVIAAELLNSVQQLDPDEVGRASRINVKFARDYLKNEN